MDKNFAKEYREVKNEALLQINSYFFNHIDEISESFRRSFNQACERIAKVQQEGAEAVEYLEFTMLRTKLIEHNYCFPIMAYGRDWYADTSQFQAGEIDGSQIYSFYEAMIQDVKKLAKKYQTKVPERCVIQCMCETAEHFWDYVEMACQWAVKGFSPEGLKITEDFKIRVCEYMGYGRVCWRYTVPMNQEKLKQWFDKRQEDGYQYRDYRGRDFSGWSFGGMNLSDCNFSDCIMENCDFESANLTGTWFCNSRMKGSSFTQAWMPGARFDGADLRNSDFTQAYSACKINESLWLRADNIAASFKGADLSGADFTFSAIECADFTGAAMVGLLLNERHQGYYLLDETQALQVQFGLSKNQEE